MSTEVLTIANLNKTYKGRRGTHANVDVSLHIREGTVLGLLGHNGAGKTTLVNQIVGILKPDSGTITVAGIDAISNPQIARQLVSVQAQANVPITGLTPRTAIQLVGKIRGGDRQHVRQRTDELLDALDLGAWADKPAQKVSGGIARLTAFAMAAVIPGKLVILDEPTNDVDPVRRRLLWQQIRSLADGGAGVLLVTHNVREAEDAVDALVILDQGRVLANGTPASLTARASGQLTLSVDLRETPQMPLWMSVASRSAHRLTAHLPVERAASAIEWASHDPAVEKFSLTPTSLEDSYIDLVSTEKVGA